MFRYSWYMVLSCFILNINTSYFKFQICSLVEKSTANEVISRTKVAPIQSRVTSCTGTGTSCNGCGQLITCVRSSVVASQSCTAINPSQPYCDQGACTSVAPQNTTGCAESTGFECSSDGLFPDPFDCRVYYSCSSMVATAYRLFSKCLLTYTNYPKYIYVLFNQQKIHALYMTVRV